MKLWDFIDGRLKDMGRNEAYLVDQGIAQNTVDRIRHGGVIKDATKQKLALALGCTAGDINRALSKRDVPEPKAHEMDLLAEEMAPEAKYAIDSFMENGSEPEEPVRVNKVKLPLDHEMTGLPPLDPGLLTRIRPVSVYDVNVEKYKARLKNKFLAMLLASDWPSMNCFFQEVGTAMIKELLGQEE